MKFNFFSNQFIFLRGKKYVCGHHWEKIKLKFNLVLNGHNHNKISKFKNDVLCNVLNEVD
jgi:hypothetical protein